MQKITNKKAIIILILGGLITLSALPFAYRQLAPKYVPETDQQVSEQETTPEIESAQPITYEFTAQTDTISAYDVLTEQATIETEDFGSAGVFVSSINGTQSDNEHYWAFFVNGEYAQQGITQTILQKGDTITFTYEKITAQ